MLMMDPPVLSVQLGDRKLLADSPVQTEQYRRRPAPDDEVCSLRNEVEHLRIELHRSSLGRTYAEKATQTDPDFSPFSFFDRQIPKTAHRPSQMKSLDEAMKSFLELHPGVAKTVTLSKVSECVYLVNQARKIHVRMVNDHILVRIGGGWQELDGFLTAHSNERLVRSPHTQSDPGLGLHQHVLTSQKRVTRTTQEEHPHKEK